MTLLCEEVLAPPLPHQAPNDRKSELVGVDSPAEGKLVSVSSHQLLPHVLADPCVEDGVLGAHEILMPGSCSMLPDPPRSPPRFVMVDRCGPDRARSPGPDHFVRLRSGIHAWLQSGDSGVTHYFEVRHPKGLPARALSFDTVVEQCAVRVCAVRDSGWNFKIGIARHPEQRLECYRREEGVRKMIILHQVREDPQEAIDLECRLIGQFMGTTQCRNRAPGGEGVNTLCTPLCVYVVAGGAPCQGLSILMEQALYGRWPRAKIMEGRGQPAASSIVLWPGRDIGCIPSLHGHDSDSDHDANSDSLPN